MSYNPLESRDKKNEKARASYKKNIIKRREISNKSYHKNKIRINKRRRKNREENIELHLLYSARRRAVEDGLECSIKIEDIILPKVCPILGTKLQMNTGKLKDDSYSIDRIDPSVGYIKNNIQVISYKANAIKRNASVEELGKVYHFMQNLTGQPTCS